MCFYFGHVLGHAFQELKSCLRLVKVLIGEIVRKNFHAESSSLFTVMYH